MWGPCRTPPVVLAADLPPHHSYPRQWRPSAKNKAMTQGRGVGMTTEEAQLCNERFRHGDAFPRTGNPVVGFHRMRLCPTILKENAPKGRDVPSAATHSPLIGLSCRRHHCQANIPISFYYVIFQNAAVPSAS